MIRHLVVPITAAMVTMGAAGAYAQSAFPAPLPGQAATSAPAASSPFPPVNGAAPTASVGTAPFTGKDDCGAVPTEAVGAAPFTGGKGELAAGALVAA